MRPCFQRLKRIKNGGSFAKIITWLIGNLGLELKSRGSLSSWARGGHKLKPYPPRLSGWRCERAIRKVLERNVEDDKTWENSRITGLLNVKGRSVRALPPVHREWGFPAESGKPSVSQPQAEWWMSAAPGNVSSLPLKLGACKVGRGKRRPASCWVPGGTNRDPFRKDRIK